ncbi:ADP-ribosylation factor-like protein 16 isoform X1 [Python bivittatus]|uniref:ADP-ribosylation factor-like protein 16 isoform X1 n=2 Tax=Python bivittatus TaxID=176946 RepID=A0A9F5MXA1_PYTBI|nr:ADP-ribosylation factor-like protein 16 isoform X1 [Python bivittatus]
MVAKNVGDRTVGLGCYGNGGKLCFYVPASRAFAGGKDPAGEAAAEYPKLSSRNGAKDLGEPPATLPTVGTNLTDLSIGKKITIRELGGCMGPIWSSYYSDCHAVLYMIDAANPTQISSSCVQLLSLLSAEQLTSVPVLLIFNKIDLPCYMSLVEMKSLLRIQDIMSCAKQAITVVEISARDGRGLSDVIKWLQSTLRD